MLCSLQVFPHNFNSFMSFPFLVSTLSVNLRKPFYDGQQTKETSIFCRRLLIGTKEDIAAGLCDSNVSRAIEGKSRETLFCQPRVVIRFY